jgi:hypothetical protein
LSLNVLICSYGILKTLQYLTLRRVIYLCSNKDKSRRCRQLLYCQALVTRKKFFSDLYKKKEDDKVYLCMFFISETNNKSVCA